MIKIYGIKNCTSVKKAFDWFDNHNIVYEFIDYKKHGVVESDLSRAMDELGWDGVVTQRGRAWQSLNAQEQQSMNRDNAMQLAADNPMAVKRPLIITNDAVVIGFDAHKYDSIFKR